MSSLLLDQYGQAIEALGGEADDDTGKNLPNSVADVYVSPPAGWEEKLREISPKSLIHSWLCFYWYRLKQRWVLYDCVPRELISPKEFLGVAFTGREFFEQVDGPPPRERLPSQRHQSISDVQWELHKVHRVYARPFWVLEGTNGGHQVTFSPEQREFLTKVGRSAKPPAIGSQPACQFDGLVVQQLRRLNRLYQLHGSIEGLRKSGTADAWEISQALREREIRTLSLEMLEQQMGELGEMVATLGHRTEAEGTVVAAHGQAAKASEALAAYVETGDWVM